MTLYNYLDRYLFLPLGDLVYGSSVVAKYKEMRSRDMLSELEIRAIQDSKLQRLVKHCYNTVPYYKRLFDSHAISPEQIKTRDDLVRLPVLTKQIIRDNYDDLFSTAISSKRIRKSSTGGSTGMPLKFCTDWDEWSSWKASTLRAWEWYGLHLGDKIFSLGGSSINKKKQLLSFKGLYDRVIMRNYKYSSADVTDEGMHRNYVELMKLKPQAIRGYGSSLYILARYIEKMGLPVCPIKVVLTTGEVLMPEYRRKLEEVFQAPVYDAYGAGDGGILSHECSKREGFHITEESCIIEITDKEGNPLPVGETGFVCSTDLDNYVFPFLRYSVGDMAYMKSEKCSCGRQTRLIGEVMGRAGKLMYNKQGVPISPTVLPMMFYPELDYHNVEYQKIYNKIDKFQIRQDANGDICILLKLKDPSEPKEQFDYVVTNYQNHFVGSKVELRLVDDIPCLPSGKEDYCVSDYRREG
ncbi:MAG: phenylacetate--CoA ligase family protein [Bacteroidales bacterium]|nr:phenylacetate--CoA ligase family protein [Bacteroidales bacterium]